MSPVLRALANPTRVRIIEILAAGPTYPSHLVDRMNATQPTISGHLRLLREAGLVAPEQHGKFTLYRLVPETLDASAAHLASLASQTRDAEHRRRQAA
jgi:ArsR family transcriptional regulator